MDQNQVDALARSLARPVDRRSALRGAVAALLGIGVARGRNAAAVCQAVGARCGSADGACCDGSVCDARSGKCLLTAGATCKVSTQCSAGMRCKNGKCEGTVVCRAMRESCVQAGNVCCTTMTCDGSQRVCLIDAGYACPANADCANGNVCRGGICAPKGQAGDTCDEDADCAGSLGCNTGESKCRAPLNGACASNADCGAGRACIGKVCIVPECPAIPCTDGKICWNGACVTPQSCEGYDGTYCYETVEGLRALGGSGILFGNGCTSVTDCLDLSGCSDESLQFYGQECICASASYFYGELDTNLNQCAAMVVDRIAGDQCTAGGQCAPDQYCENGTCRPMEAGECHSYEDCPDSYTSACCNGLCYQVEEGVGLEHCGWCGNTCGTGQICCNYDCIDVALGVTACP